ncbi:DinB family protein [Pareuzebyella sediminis]|uniref:DinB family protein n=1 Tax=Pareuzebyella sediminis TaxID=2607998 RepID=UPI0011EE4071|nr:DinB family protein [Pareuzebyella sediminis]
MKTPMKKTALILTFLSLSLANAQYEIEPAERYTQNIGIMVSMLEDLKNRITEQVKDLDQSQTDFLYDGHANSIGALVMHLVSTEAYYRIETLEGRPWTEEEQARLGVAGELGDESKKNLKGKPIRHYLDLWDEVRQRTLAGLKTKDDEWFASNIEEGINYHWVWYHVLEHSANHMGQIATIKNRFPE